MAVILQSNSGVIDNHSYANLYSKTIDAVIAQTATVPREGRQFVAERTTNLDTYTEAEVFSTLDNPHRNEDTDVIPLLNPVEGYSKTWTNLQYRAGIMVTERAVLAQKHAMIAKMIQGLPASTVLKEERLIATLFNSGFATLTTADGQYIFDTDHTKEDPQAGTWTNAAASGAGFTTTTLETARRHFATFTNEKGHVTPQPMGKVVFPPALWESVNQVLNSDKYPQNALNAKSPFQGIVSMVEYHWLTSTTAWFIQGSSNALDQGFLFVWQSRPKYDTLTDGMNPQLIMGKSVVMRCSVGALHSRPWWGNVGA